MRKPAGKAALSASSTLGQAPTHAKHLRYKNIRYGCKLCPSKVFSQLAAPARSRTRESAVEGHVRRHHPREVRHWRKIAYRWGVRAYYTDYTTADIRNPSELPPVMENDDEEGGQDEQDEADSSTAPILTSGFDHANEHPIDSRLQTEFQADIKEGAGGQYIKVEDGEVSVWKYVRNAVGTQSEDVDGFGEHYSHANTPNTDYTSLTTMDTAINTRAEEPRTVEYGNQEVPHRAGDADGRQLLPPIQLPPIPHTDTIANNCIFPEAYLPSQTSYFQKQSQIQAQMSCQTSSELSRPQSSLTAFDSGAIEGSYGPRMAWLAGQVFLAQQGTREERIHVVGQYLQETRKVLMKKNYELQMMLQGYQERYGVISPRDDGVGE